MIAERLGRNKSTNSGCKINFCKFGESTKERENGDGTKKNNFVQLLNTRCLNQHRWIINGE